MRSDCEENRGNVRPLHRAKGRPVVHQPETTRSRGGRVSRDQVTDPVCRRLTHGTPLRGRYRRLMAVEAAKKRAREHDRVLMERSLKQVSSRLEQCQQVSARRASRCLPQLRGPVSACATPRAPSPRHRARCKQREYPTARRISRSGHGSSTPTENAGRPGWQRRTRPRKTLVGEPRSVATPSRKR